MNFFTRMNRFRKLDITKAYNFVSIDELTSSSGTIKGLNLKSMSKAGYEAVINLLPSDSEHARPNEKQDFEKLGIDYVYIPVDWNSPKQADFDAFTAAMNELNGKKVHIHCGANYRVSAFYAVYASKNMGWSESKLNEFIGSIWQLSNYPVWQRFISELTAS
jgi:protein tyrosine phosphatase (PTP) superfamily phosphohydrolase (DUF442 family)